jgi:hypothetical protein
MYWKKMINRFFDQVTANTLTNRSLDQVHEIRAD